MVLLWFCLAGALAAALFDMMRLLRASWPHPTALVWAEDILWSAACFLGAYACVIRYAGGVVRWFYLFAFFAAMILWFLLISPWLLRIAKAVSRLIFRVFRILFAPIVWLLRKAARLFEKLFSKNRKLPIAKDEMPIV